MQRKRILTLAIVLVLAVVFIGGPITASAADKNVTRKMILGGRLGDGWFVLSQALAYFINKQSDWLRVEVVATPGASAGAYADSGQTHPPQARLSAGLSGRRRADRLATGRGSLHPLGSVNGRFSAK